MGNMCFGNKNTSDLRSWWMICMMLDSVRPVFLDIWHVCGCLFGSSTAVTFTNAGNVSKTKHNFYLNQKIGRKLFQKISFCICIYSACSDFLKFCISQGSVAMQLSGGGIFSNHVLANCLQSEPKEKFLKSVKIWQRYGWKSVACFFLWLAAYY